MPSINKTPYLGLHMWDSSDRPTRADFVSDNYAIDSAVGNHVNNTVIHLSEEEKGKITQPYVFAVLQGTDEETRSYTLDFTPSVVIYFAASTPAVTTESGSTVVNQAFSIFGYGSSGGLSIGNNVLKIKQKEIDNVLYNLNNSSKQYYLVAFK